MASVDEIGTIFDVMTTNYGYIQRDRKPSELAALLDIWKQTLSDIDGYILRLAALKIISTSKWFPSVSELREAALDISEPKNRRTGLEAWGDVVAAFHHGGHWGIPEFSDPIVADVVKSLDWQTLCLSEDQTADRARFIAAYEAITDRRKTDALTLPEVRQVQQQIAGGNGNALSEMKRLANKMESQDDD